MTDTNGNPVQQGHEASTHASEEELHSDSEQEEETLDNTNPRSFVAPAILAQLAHLDLSNKLRLNQRRVIAVGGYSDVLRGHYNIEGRSRVRVCVKRLRMHLREDVKMLFEKEIYVWSKLNHSNVLPLLGYSFDNDSGYPMLISEWMTNGSAWDYVSVHPRCDLMHLILGIANGLAYLHERKVVHSDLKSDNVLVTDSGEAVICDFGCSRMLAASKSLANLSSGLKGTPRYWPPEFLASSDSRHSQMADVWSFGMTVFELLARQRPWGDAPDGQIIGALWRHDLPKLPEVSEELVPRTIKENLWKICQICWEPDPSRRPSMGIILERLGAPEVSQTKTPAVPLILGSGGGPILYEDSDSDDSETDNEDSAGEGDMEHNFEDRDIGGDNYSDISEREDGDSQPDPDQHDDEAQADDHQYHYDDQQGGDEQDCYDDPSVDADQYSDDGPSVDGDYDDYPSD